MVTVATSLPHRLTRALPDDHVWLGDPRRATPYRRSQRILHARSWIIRRGFARTFDPCLYPTWWWAPRRMICRFGMSWQRVSRFPDPTVYRHRSMTVLVSRSGHACRMPLAFPILPDRAGRRQRLPGLCIHHGSRTAPPALVPVRTVRARWLAGSPSTRTSRRSHASKHVDGRDASPNPLAPGGCYALPTSSAACLSRRMMHATMCRPARVPGSRS